MSYFTASQIGKALAKARVSAGLSQTEIARRIEKGERTVQSWEKGCTSPDSDEIMDWCTACGVSPITVFMEVLHLVFHGSFLPGCRGVIGAGQDAGRHTVNDGHFSFFTVPLLKIHFVFLLSFVHVYDL